MINEQVFNITEADNSHLAGGKAYALGEMIRAGFNVPNGFVLSSSSFMSMTPSLRRTVLGRFDTMQMDYVAVRSSAINEDGKDAAWAGQLDTFLNSDRDNLLKNIKKCWKSADSARAQSYAHQKAIQSTKVAVIVQEMIQSEVSGVAFSVHPVTNDDTQVVIEAGLGLGEAVVSGHITPDTYVIDKKTEQLIERHIAQQTKKLARNTTGETLWQDTDTQRNSQKLTDERIIELCGLTSKLEKYFKHPVDVEWAISDDKIYVLQCRPITTLMRE